MPGNLGPSELHHLILLRVDDLFNRLEIMSADSKSSKRACESSMLCEVISLTGRIILAQKKLRLPFLYVILNPRAFRLIYQFVCLLSHGCDVWINYVNHQHVAETCSAFLDQRNSVDCQTTSVVFLRLATGLAIQNIHNGGRFSLQIGHCSLYRIHPSKQ